MGRERRGGRGCGAGEAVNRLYRELHTKKGNKNKERGRGERKRDPQKETPNGLEKSSNVGTPLLETSKESSEVNVRIFQPMSK